MTVAKLLVLAAVLASLLLTTRSSARLWPGLALVASGLEALLLFGVVSLSVSGFNLGLILAAVLAVAGGAAWLGQGSKASVTAATIVVLVGVVQLLGYLL